MRFNRFDLNLLVVLDALLSEKNITRAGQKLYLSQSATSGALARLREYFDDQILTQVGRNMVLTPLGESLIKPVRSLLLQAQATLDRRPEFNPAESKRHFIFVMSDYTATVLMPTVILKASKLAPGITLEIMTPSNEPLEELEHGHADFLLMPDNFLTENHPRANVFEEDFVCVCCADNPHIKDEISREQYEEIGHVVVRFGSRRRPSVDEWLTDRAGVERHAEVTVNSFAAVPQCIIGTHRIATIHRRLANLWSREFSLKVLPPPLVLPTMNWGLQWHQFRDLDPGTIWLKNLIVDTASQFRDSS
jgi:LysR family nod box-dependent transcriptional activator